ncbi:14271_t:CDS:2, partial [Acaulospora colombiana]
MPDSSPVIGSALPQQGAVLSAETLLAIRKYNQEVASYTLRQWNVAKLESERKERDRRKRRADALAQRAASNGTNNTGGVGAGGSLSSATPGGGKMMGHGLGSVRAGSRPPPSDRAHPHHPHQHNHHHYGPPDSDGPLMMVSRRKTDRALSGPTSTALPFGQRHSHDGRYPPHNQLHQHKPYPSQDLLAIEQRPTHHQASVSAGPRLHTRSYQIAAPIPSSVHVPAAAAATCPPLDPNTAHPFDRPATQHIESVAIGLAGEAEDKEDVLLDEPLVTPPRSWQRRLSGSTPPIPIPAPRQQQHPYYHHSRSHSQPCSNGQQGVGLSGSSAASSVSAQSHSPHMTSGSSRSSSSHLSRHSPPARALGFSAHFGMTSISHGAASVGAGAGVASTSVTTTSDSASSSNPTSEGSSRISSYSESTLRQSLKKDDDPVSAREKSGRPKAVNSSSSKGCGGSVNTVE